MTMTMNISQCSWCLLCFLRCHRPAARITIRQVRPDQNGHPNIAQLCSECPFLGKNCPADFCSPPSLALFSNRQAECLEKETWCNYALIQPLGSMTFCFIWNSPVATSHHHWLPPSWQMHKVQQLAAVVLKLPAGDKRLKPRHDETPNPLWNGGFPWKTYIYIYIS